jgi:hypothetical protein
MKISWGHKILFTYLAFVVGIMSLVYLTSLQSRDLVAENYYAEELAYQKIIDQSANTASLSQNIQVEQLSDKIIIHLPGELQDKKSAGKWSLYFAADSKKDINGNFETKTGKTSILLPAKASGLYNMILQWETNGKDYYFEKTIFL